MAKPEYRVTERCFIAPHTLLPGAVIRTDMEPSGRYLEPLNAEAEAKMEKWYNKEYVTRDEKGNERVHKPNLLLRPFTRQEKAESRATVELVSNPPPDNTPVMGLAEANLARAEPALVPTGDGETSRLNIPQPRGAPVIPPSDQPTAGSTSVDGKVEVVDPGPPITGSTPPPPPASPPVTSPI